MRFFNPTSDWLAWFKRYVGNRVVYDVGCGEGHVTAALRSMGMGIPVLGIEAYALKLDPALFEADPGAYLIGDVLNYSAPLKSRAFPVFFRPCHGGWVRRTYREIAGDDAPVWGYVGLPKNVDDDLEGLLYQLQDGPEGPDGERLWLFSSSRGSLRDYRKWYLVSDDAGRVRWGHVVDRLGPGAKDVDPRQHPEPWFVNTVGGGFRFSGEILDEAFVECEYDLDMRATSEYKHHVAQQDNESIRSGWLTPSGGFLRAAYWDHANILRVMFGMSEHDAEKEGWARVSVHNGRRCVASPSYGKRLSEAQEVVANRWLDEDYGVFEAGDLDGPDEIPLPRWDEP